MVRDLAGKRSFRSLVARNQVVETMEGTMKHIVLLLTIATCALAAQDAAAQADLGFKRIGGAIGYVSPEDVDGVFSLGVFADHGTIAPRIGLESRIDYWSHSEDAFGVEASIRDITVGARGKYYFEVTGSSLRPFAGAGLGLHFLSAKVAMPPVPGFPATTVEDSSTKLGLDLGGGVATAINPQLDFLGELWYGIVSDVSQLSLRVGVSYKLGS
jgi:opacity protein-like surface antigen